MHSPTPRVRTDFRPDINGLRAWAVVAVVLYHFHIPGFAGGFVGVDVFFVISGFLMTGLVMARLEASDFSFRDFYIARARRIVPALAVLCGVLLALGWWVLLAPDYRTLATHAISSLTFISNFKYWGEAGYFDVGSHEKWLLHTWSLSVEWQFYLALPVVMWGVWRVRPGRAAQCVVLGLGMLASFAVSIWGTSDHPSAAFYLLHTRAWELLAGGLVFFAGRQTWSGVQRKGMEMLGLGLIVVSIIGFDSGSAWPGWRAAVPVLGAALVLLAGQASLWTGSRAAQWLGDRSYSLYLWHWPLVVVLVYTGLQSEWWAVVLAVVGAVVLGDLSFRWIELPTRRGLARLQLPAAGGALVGCGAALLMVAGVVRGQDGMPGRFSEAVQVAAAEESNVNPRRTECHPHVGTSSPSCVYGGQRWAAIVLGDSHAAAVVTGVAAALVPGAGGVVQWSYSGCPFLPGVEITDSVRHGKAYQCDAFNAWALARLDTVPADIPVILVGRYIGLFGASGAARIWAGDAEGASKSDPVPELGAHITQAACRLAQRRTVYLVRPIPEFGTHVPRALARRMAWGLHDSDVSIPLARYQADNAWVIAAQDAARDQCGARILDTAAYLCRDGQCHGSAGQRPLYHDDNHLSEFGNKQLVKMFEPVFRPD